MPQRPGTLDRPLIPAGPTSARLVGPDQFFRRLHNLYPTEAGGLRSVSTAVPYLTNSGATPVDGVAHPATPVVYGVCRSIFHAVVGDGARELLLLHVDNQIWEFMGWDRQWRILVADSASSPIFAQNLWEPLPTDYPTQWVKTPKGVVIIPAGGGQAMFYDGTVILQLGYTDRPGAPIGLGPSSSGPTLLPDDSVTKLGVNDEGYASDGLAAQTESGMPTVFRTGRLGTVEAINGSSDPTADANASGYLIVGRYRACVQWVDYFGNLSALSFPSNDIHFDRQPAMQISLDAAFIPDASTGSYVAEYVNLSNVKKQVGWGAIRSGPKGTIGRIVWRTKDITGKGDTNLYEVPADAAANTNAFATLPDNITHFLPDNIPDEWLFNLPQDIEPVPPFRLAWLAFGRLFMANSRAEPGKVWVSEVGRYGTVLSEFSFYPDAQGAEVTGGVFVSAGLLLFSRNSTYLVTEDLHGSGFRSQTLDSTKGCVAPSSIKTLRGTGKTLWLGRDGFYSWSPADGVQFEWYEQREEARRFNRGRIHQAVSEVDPRSGQYRCWVPMAAALLPDLCWCYDDAYGWTTRDDVAATGVTVTDDARDMMIVSGERFDGDAFGDSGVWVLDRNGTPASAEILSAWQRGLRSDEPASTRRVKVLLRETMVGTTTATMLRAAVERDYRVGEVGDPFYIHLFPDEGTPQRLTDSTEPNAWDSVTWGAATFRERRPYWVSADFNVPECEVWRLKLTADERFEFLGFAYEEQPRNQGGAAGYK